MKPIRSRLKILIPVAIIALVATLALTLADKPLAPDFRFKTIHGTPMDTATQSSKITLINFWATYCPGCINEMPELIETYKQYRNRGFEVIAIAVPDDSLDLVQAYTAKNQLPFPVAYDADGSIVRKFDNVRVTPTSYVLDSQKRIIQTITGEINFNDLRQLLDEQLGS